MVRLRIAPNPSLSDWSGAAALEDPALRDRRLFAPSPALAGEGAVALPQHEFGLDVIALIGALRHREHRTELQTAQPGVHFSRGRSLWAAWRKWVGKTTLAGSLTAACGCEHAASVMPATIASIYRYPVKGLSGELLDRTALAVDQGLPGDRQFALARAGTRFENDETHWQPKTSFVTLTDDERLAALTTSYREADGTLTICRGGRKVVQAKLTTPIGRGVVEEFFSAYLRDQISGRPRLVTAPERRDFSDQSEPLVSLINLASVRDLERVVGEVVDPLRFRANVYLDGTPPWSELHWPGMEIAIGDARLVVKEKIACCAATSVRPGRGIRDMNIPQALRQGFGHGDCGVYGRVISAGTIAVGDTLRVSDPADQ